MSYEPRTYRGVVTPAGLTTFEVVIKETDLQISAASDLTGPAEDLVAQARWQIESYVASNPRFAETWSPIDVPEDAPDLIRAMGRAAHLARVGPMAAVAGVVAEYVARGLESLSAEVVVENGGDIYMVGKADRTIALWAGKSSLTGKVGLRIPGGLMPVAVCTSSGTVGHSASLGSADAATVIAHDGALADAVATALANRVHSAEDIQRAIDACKAITGVLGLLVVIGDHLGAWGNIHLTALEAS
ncbi:MAG TPA: UPF0280 family protein [Coriobacteriia bacterium]|jgi:hypothetical protein